MLAIFPRGEALHRLNRTVTGLFLIGGLVLLIKAGKRRAWFSAGLVILALHLGLEILGRIGNANFSINAFLAPMLLAGLLATAILRLQTNSPTAWKISLLALIGGLCFGLAVLIRLPVILLLPGLLVFLWPAKNGRWRWNGVAAFGLGTLVSGVLPVLAFQRQVAGAWYLPTYGSSDAAPPALAVLKSNLSFYLGNGPGSSDNWALPLALVGCIGLFLWQGVRREPNANSRSVAITWRRLMLSALLVWLLPTAYFLTHKVAIHYYAVPAMFGTVLLLALGAFQIESSKAPGNRARRNGLLRVAGIVLVLAPALMVIGRVWSNYVPATAEIKSRQFVLPAELAQDKAWVWADMLSGTLWYYAHKPAHKIHFTGPATRALLFDFVRDRSEPQYIIQDGPDMQRMEDEMVQSGARLEKRGEVDGYPYFLIHWPANALDKSVTN